MEEELANIKGEFHDGHLYNLGQHGRGVDVIELGIRESKGVWIGKKYRLQC